MERNAFFFKNHEPIIFKVQKWDMLNPEENAFCRSWGLMTMRKKMSEKCFWDTNWCKIKNAFSRSFWIHIVLFGGVTVIFRIFLRWLWNQSYFVSGILNSLDPLILDIDCPKSMSKSMSKMRGSKEMYTSSFSPHTISVALTRARKNPVTKRRIWTYVFSIHIRVYNNIIKMLLYYEKIRYFIRWWGGKRIRRQVGIRLIMGAKLFVVLFRVLVERKHSGSNASTERILQCNFFHLVLLGLTAI